MAGRGSAAAEADPKPVISVVMVRDLGSAAWSAALIRSSSGLIFALLCAILHRRDAASPSTARRRCQPDRRR